MTLYTWGLGKNGQLGTGKAATEHTPQQVKLLHVSQVSCGALFTAVVTSEGRVCCTGCGKYGRLGLGEEEDVLTLALVKLPSKVVKISCGSWHAAAVLENGQVYVWGYRKACGDAIVGGESAGEQSNVSASAIKIPCLLPFGDSMKIAGVSCGHNYTYVWTTEGQLFSWGRGQDGELGQGSDKDVTQPKKVECLADKAVITVGAGHSHCGIVTSDGLLFMTGKGSDGALGLGQTNLKNVLAPVQCQVEEKITAVSCSKGEHHGHTLALTEKGSVLAWGDGYKGKLGLGDQETRYTPTLISQDHFNGEIVCSVSAGGIHSAAATVNGGVFTWGCGSDGRLGHPEGQGHRYLFRSDVPKKVEQLPKNGEGHAQVSAAYYHTAAVIDL